MKGCLSIIVCAVAFFAFCIFLTERNKGGDTISVYATGNGAEWNVRRLDNWLSAQPNAPRVRLTNDPSSADVTLRFTANIDAPDAAAVSYVYRGHMDVDERTPYEQLPNVLAHEFMHLSGASHSDEGTDVMRRYTSDQPVSLTAQQIADLRRLSGMTPMQRLRAQIAAIF